MLFLGCYLPLKRADQRGTEKLTPMFTHAETSAYGAKLGEMGRQFSHLMRQVEDLSVSPIMPPVPRALVKSLYDQGSNIRSSGFTWRPAYFAQDRVAAIMKDYLRFSKGPTYDIVPVLDFEQVVCQRDSISQDLRCSWTLAARRFGQGALQVRRLRRDASQTVLSFSSS